MVAVFTIFAIVSRAVASQVFHSRYRRAHTYLCAFLCIAYVVYIHRAGAIFLILEVLFFYLLAHLHVPMKPLLLWAVVIFALISNEINDGFSFGGFVTSWSFMDHGVYRGILPWHISFNLVALRLLSYGLDLHAAGGMQRPKAVIADMYSLSNFILYVFYLPLYITGPTI